MTAPLALGEKSLTFEQYGNVADGRLEVRLSDSARRRMQIHRESLMRQLASGAAIYGVNTGYGADSTRRLAPETIRTVQRNTILSHVVGVGPDVPRQLVRGMLFLKAAVLAKGYSAVRPELVDLICGLLNQDIVPVVPEQGSLAASGDLVPSGHLAMALIGEGDVTHSGRKMAAADALRAAGLVAIELEEKEGLALVNGTVFTEAYAIEVVISAERLLKTADLAGAATLQALKGHLGAFSERAVEVRPFPGALDVAANVRQLCAGSELLAGDSGRVHDPYCIRCMPQVHGASRDAFAYVKRAVETELDACTDNPLIFEDGTWTSAGNFHAQPIGIPMDTAAVLVGELASISQRRTQHLVAPVYDVGLPVKLSRRPDLGSGLFMANTTAAALVSENKTLSFPASVDSIAVDTTEDHVSMGSVGARKALAIVANTANVLAIELICACQALDLQAPLKASLAIRALRDAVRETVSFVESDRPLSGDVTSTAQRILSGEFMVAVDGKLSAPLR
ncbi:MAG: histidine ammonia-lyase [Candidatus Dormibacteraeota bacterium]|nr:histidine ammonia-lyase [Candidatus Dormibacteraeota bacterium]